MAKSLDEPPPAEKNTPWPRSWSQEHDHVRTPSRRPRYRIPENPSAKSILLAAQSRGGNRRCFLAAQRRGLERLARGELLAVAAGGGALRHGLPVAGARREGVVSVTGGERPPGKIRVFPQGAKLVPGCSAGLRAESHAFFGGKA